MNIIEWTNELRFVVAIALGFLVGLERESSKGSGKGKLILGGVRTYPIISMFGFGCAWLHQNGVIAILPIGLIALAGLTAISFFTKAQSERFGITSEISALLTFIVGALSLLVDVWVAMSLGIINTLLLSEKSKMEEFVESLDRVEFLAVLKFLLVTLIILPVLPNKDFTIFKLNPTTIWGMVIAVSTIGFVGYYLSKKFGDRLGFWLSGLAGGIVSSTAVTIAYGRIAKKNSNLAYPALQGSIIASSMMHVRLLVLIIIISPALAQIIWWKLVLLNLFGVALSLIKFQNSPTKSKKEKGIEQLQNPFEIRPSLIFALLFVLLTIITTLVKQHFGQSGLFFLSAVIGVTDITPFVLSIINETVKSYSVVGTAIIISMMSNTLMKGLYFTYLAESVRKETLLRFGLLALLHLPFILFS